MRGTEIVSRDDTDFGGGDRSAVREGLAVMATDDLIPSPETETPAEIQQRLAVERTQLAHQRTFLSEERTYSAWVRTGLASVAAGFALGKLITTEQVPWLPSLVGALFIMLGTLQFMIAFSGYRRAVLRYRGTVRADIPLWVITLLTFVMLLGSVLALLIVGIE